MNTNKLQFLHHSSPFQTVEEAKGYVLNLIGDGSLRLAIGEPLVLVYGQTDDLSALIGMGTKEDGTGVFFIDQDADVADIRRIKTILANIVSSCGFDENGRLKPFSGEIISRSSNVEDAIEELASHIKAMSLAVSDTKTVDLTLANRHGESGLTADVRVPRSIMMGGNVFGNTLQVGDDGLYVYVDIAHTLGTNKFKMTINDQVKEIDLEDTVKSGVYDNAMKSIVLTLNNNNKVYINLQEFFNEFKAGNIVCWLPSGEKSNLQSVVSSGGVVSNFESANETNIIRSVGGLFASVNLTYDALTNTLVFTKSDKDEISKVTEIQLNSASVLDHIYYDRTKEELVLIYHTTDGQRQEVRIPISDLFEEWYTDNSNSTVTLVKDRSVQGYTSLKGNVNVAPLSLVPHNILQEFHNAGFHGLSVNGVAENIAYGNGTVKDALDTMSVDLAAEITARENADNALQNALVAETNARTQADTELRNAIVAEINERERVDSGLSNAIQAETVARENTDNELRGLISAETVARENADSALRTDLDAEIIARQSGDTVNAQTIEAEENRAKTEENRLAQLISAETEARVAGDDALRGLVADEISARTSADTQLRADLDAEISARENADAGLNDAIGAEVAIRTSADTAIHNIMGQQETGYTANTGTTYINNAVSLNNADVKLDTALAEEATTRARTDAELRADLDEEISARTSADNAITQAIAEEMGRATNAENQLSQLISAEASAREHGDADLSGAISAEVAARISGDSALSDAIGAEESRARDRENKLEDIINRNKVTVVVPREEAYLQMNEDKSASGTVYTLSTSGIASQAALSLEIENRTSKDATLSGAINTAFDKIDELNQTIRGAQLEVSGDSVINVRVEGDDDEPLVKTIHINANIDPNEHNIIQPTNDGLFARVQLGYDETTNTLTFDNGILEPTQIHLMGGSLISGITYDSSTNSLVIVYEVATESGTSVEEVSIPVSDFFKPVVPNNSGRTATVVTGTTPDGNQSVGVNVNIYQDSNNMLETRTGHGGIGYLFVDGTPIRTLNDKVNEVDTQVSELSGAVEGKQDEDFVIQMVKTGNTSTDISANTTLAEAFSAMSAGKNLVIDYTLQGHTIPAKRLALCEWSLAAVSSMTFGEVAYQVNDNKTTYTGIFWFNDNYDIISEISAEIPEQLSAGTGLDITNNVISLTAQTGGNYSGASGVTLEQDGITFRGVIDTANTESYLGLGAGGFYVAGISGAIEDAVASAKNYADSAISSAISSGDFAHLNKVGSLATGEEQKLVLQWVDSRSLPSSGTVYNTETHQIETYSHGENVFAESPSKNVVYCRVSDNTLWRWDGNDMTQISVGTGGTDIHVSGVTVVTVSGGVDSEGTSIQMSDGVYLKTVFEGSSNKIYTPLSGVVIFQNSETVTFNVTTGNVVTAQIGDANGVVDCGDYYPVSNMIYEPETPDITGATEYTGTTTGGTLNPSQPVNP